jgi:ornithine carbamoyltransferase
MLLGGLFGSRLTIACPQGHDPDPRVERRSRELGAEIAITRDPMEAARGADVLYTDVWISMGQEGEREQRLETFSRYQLSEPLVAAARPSALVMHCLPAHRGEEITDAVLDGPRSIVLDQAENRLHAQKAIILELLGGTVDDV